LALVELSVIEQRYRAVLAVLAGATVTEVAAQLGVSRQTLHAWKVRYGESGLAGLADRSRRPWSCPQQAAPAVEAAVCELRRTHPRWGPRRIAHELVRSGCPGRVPSQMTVYRILVRRGLLQPSGRRNRREGFTRWQRDAPMQLWQLDIVGGVVLVDPATGARAEAKVVTGVDDHSRYWVLATVVARATGRAVCLAFVEALRRYGVPEEVRSDNGKQFTARFGQGGEVLFDRICRDNGIAHRLTQPASPTTTGKVERFHQTLRRELLDDHEPFPSLAAAQAALEGWVADYNTIRPHQALGMASPADRFRPVPAAEREALPLRLPAALSTAPSLQTAVVSAAAPTAATPRPSQPDRPASGAVQDALAVLAWAGGPVEFDRVVPPSGNLQVAGKQFWLGPARAGLTVTFWADTEVIHLLIAGARVKTVRSHLSVADLAVLAARGGRVAGPPPLPPPHHGAALEVDRVVNGAGLVSLGGRAVLAAEILAGQQAGIRIDGSTLQFFDLDSRQLLRTHPNPLSHDQARRLRGARAAGPPPRPSTEPVRVQPRASDTGVIVVCGQKVALGRIHAGRTVAVHVADTTLAIDLDGDARVVQRTTNRPVRNLKADRPRTVTHVL
jgi:transposase InsO family protein